MNYGLFVSRKVINYGFLLLLMLPANFGLVLNWVLGLITRRVVWLHKLNALVTLSQALVT